MTENRLSKLELIAAAKNEIAGMAKEGMQHPSTKPVLAGAVLGAAAGIALRSLSLPLGLAAGAGYALYKRIRP